MRSANDSQPGLEVAVNSVTFRALPPGRIVDLLVDNEVAAIEWAGDIHVPSGSLEVAQVVRDLCRVKDIRICGYGSYYQCDNRGPGSGPFSMGSTAADVLQTAAALGTDSIRVWAGRISSASATNAYRNEVETCLRQLCDQAIELDMQIHLEFHRNTLTDSAQSTNQLISAVGRENLYSYWQPRHRTSEEGGLDDIRTLGSVLSHVHVFNWVFHGDVITRRPLSEARSQWIRYLDEVSRNNRHQYAIIEFVRNDSPVQFLEDLNSLREIIQEVLDSRRNPEY